MNPKNLLIFLLGISLFLISSTSNLVLEASQWEHLPALSQNQEHVLHPEEFLLHSELSNINQGGSSLIQSLSEIGGTIQDVTVNGNFAFAGEGSRFTVFNIGNPSQPVVPARIQMPDIVWGIFQQGNFVYVATGSGGLQIIDVGNPNSPGTIGSYPLFYARNVFVSGNLAYVVSGGTLDIIDVTNPTAPGMVGSFNTPGTPWDVYVTANRAFVADSMEGLQIINISNPANPTLLGNYNTPGNAFGVQVNGNVAYVADHREGLQILDVSDPANPSLLGTYDTDSFAQ